jgi:hypothetical protein
MDAVHNAIDLGACGIETLAVAVVRTFLSWSLVVEMEGHWPWKN